MGTTIDSLELQIEQNSDKAIKGLDSLSASLEKLKGATKGGMGLTSVVSQLNKLNTELKNVELSNIDNLDDLANVLDKLKGLGQIKLSPTIANQIAKLGKAMSTITPEGVNNLTNTISQLERMANLGEVTAPNISNLTRDITNVAPTEASTTTAVPLDDTAVEINRYEDAVQRAGVTTGYLRDQMTRAGSQIKMAYVSASQNVTSAFGAIKLKVQEAWTAIKNAPSNILTNIATIPIKIADGFMKAARKVGELGARLKEAVSSKIKSGFKNLIKNFSDLGLKATLANSKIGQFARSLAISAMYRAVRTIISAFTKAVKEGTDNLYQFSKVADGTFSRSLDSIATNCLYLKNSIGAMVSPLINMLAPILDVITSKLVTLLNAINQVFSRLSGASVFTKAKKQATEYASATSSAAGATKKAAKEIKDATLGIDELNIISPLADTDTGGGARVETPNYADMFETAEIDAGIKDFVDKVKALFNAGDWKGLGQLLGSKINEAIDSVDWSGLGSKLGYYANGFFQTLYYTLDTIDFNNFGKHLGELINAGLEQMDFTYVGRLLVKKTTLIFDTLIGALGQIDWSLVGKSIGDFLRGAFDEAYEWITSYNWGEMGASLYDNLKKTIEGIDFATVAQSFFEALGAAIGAAASFIGSFIKGVVTDIKDYFVQYITDENGDGQWGAGEIISGVFQGIIDALGNIGTWIKDNIFTPFIDGFKASFGIASPSKVMSEQGSYIVEGLYQGIKDHSGDGIDTIKGWAGNVVEWFTKGEDGRGIVENFKETASNIVGGFTDKISSDYTASSSTMTSWATNIKNAFTSDGEGAVNETSFGTYASNVVSGFSNTIGSTYTTAKTNIDVWANGIKTWFTTIANDKTFGTMAIQVINGFKNSILANYKTSTNAMTTFATNVVGYFKNAGGGIVSSFYNIGVNIVQGFIDGVKSLWDSAMSLISSFGEAIISMGRIGTQERSPSRAFKQIGAYVVEGFNIGLEDEMSTTFDVMQVWLDKINSFTPNLSVSVDKSALQYMDGMNGVQVGTNNTLVDRIAVAQNEQTIATFASGMQQAVSQALVPYLSDIADSSRETANKDFTTVIGDREIARANARGQKSLGMQIITQSV